MFSYNEYRHRIDNCFRNRRFTISMPENERSSIIEELQGPVKTIDLYQYRRCNEFSFNDFLQNQITLTHPRYFNDCFEVKPYFNLEEYVKTYNMFDINAAKRLIRIAKIRDFTPEEIQEIGGENTACLFKLISRKLIEENAEEKYYADFETIQQNALMQQVSLINQFCSSKPNETRIACFSESCDSPIMWGHYADSGKGFCVKHTFPVLSGMSLCPNDNNLKCDKANSCVKEQCIKSGYNWLIPVNYSSERPDFTKELELQLVQTQFQLMGLNADWSNYDLLTQIKFACYKSLDWAYEREWRWIRTLCTNEVPEFAPISVGTTSGLYLGADISHGHENILKEYASKYKLPDGSNIPIYKMFIDLSEPRYKLVANKVT